MRNSRSMAAMALAASVLASPAWSGAIAPPDPDPQVLEVRRIYVERLNGGESAQQIRDLLIAALQRTRRFILTENEERADAVLRGSAEESSFTQLHQSHEGITARVNTGGFSESERVSGQTSSSRIGASGLSIGENESIRSTERKHEALATVRLVNRDGDVLWSTTQESTGAKFRGAAADVADKVARQLILDLDRAARAKSKLDATRPHNP